MNVKDIIKGHFKEMLNDEQALSDSRLAICKQCPLLKETAIGLICNSALFLNVETGEVREDEHEGFHRGCGCRLNAKSRLPDAKCPLDKWR